MAISQRYEESLEDWRKEALGDWLDEFENQKKASTSWSTIERFIAYGRHILHSTTKNLPFSKEDDYVEEINLGADLEKTMNARWDSRVVSKIVLRPNHPGTQKCYNVKCVPGVALEGCDNNLYYSVTGFKSHYTAIHCGMKGFRCLVTGCSSQFASRYKTIRHIISSHQIVKRFQCDACGVKFGNISALTTHTTKGHANPRGKSVFMMDENKQLCFRPLKVGEYVPGKFGELYVAQWHKKDDNGDIVDSEVAVAYTFSRDYPGASVLIEKSVKIGAENSICKGCKLRDIYKRGYRPDHNAVMGLGIFVAGEFLTKQAKFATRPLLDAYCLFEPEESIDLFGSYVSTLRDLIRPVLPKLPLKTQQFFNAQATSVLVNLAGEFPLVKTRLSLKKENRRKLMDVVSVTPASSNVTPTTVVRKRGALKVSSNSSLMSDSTGSEEGAKQKGQKQQPLKRKSSENVTGISHARHVKTGSSSNTTTSTTYGRKRTSSKLSTSSSIILEKSVGGKIQKMDLVQRQPLVLKKSNENQSSPKSRPVKTTPSSTATSGALEKLQQRDAILEKNGSGTATSNPPSSSICLELQELMDQAPEFSDPDSDQDEGRVIFKFL